MRKNMDSHSKKIRLFLSNVRNESATPATQEPVASVSRADVHFRPIGDASSRGATATKRSVAIKRSESLKQIASLPAAYLTNSQRERTANPRLVLNFNNVTMRSKTNEITCTKSNIL